MLTDAGINSYLAGCITQIFPKRKETKLQNKIFMVDVSEELKKRILPKFKNENIIELSHILKGDDLLDFKSGIKKTEERLVIYRNEAKLVITSRLHCLSPCITMGILVIGLFTNISPRMGWIDKLCPFHTVEDMDKINWSGYTINTEGLKAIIKNVAITKIKNAYDKYNNIFTLSQFYEERERSQYGNYYYKIAKSLDFNSRSKEYFIWGAGQIGLEIVRVMKECFPQVKLSGVIDSYSAGKVFLGIKIEVPSAIQEKHMNTLCIIATYSGESFVKNYLSNIGKTDYITMSSVNG